jgi:hypothetical protein
MSAQEPLVPPALSEEFVVSRRRSSEHHDRTSMSSSRSALKPRGFRAGVGLQNCGAENIRNIPPSGDSFPVDKFEFLGQRRLLPSILQA